MDKPKSITSRLMVRVKNLLESPETLIPQEKTDTKSELGWQRYKTVDFFSKRNQFAKDLLLLSEIVPTHRSCIYTKADYEFSEGFGLVKGKSQSIIKTKTKAESQVVGDDVISATADALQHVNLQEESYLDVCKQVRINLNSSGNGYLELVWGDLFGKRYFNVYGHDFTSVLIEQRESPMSPVTHAYISPDWSNAYVEKNAPTKLPIYPRYEYINGSFRSLMHIKEFSVGRNVYGLPLFVAAKVAAQLEYESDRHNLERFFSDFMPKFFAGFLAPNGMTDDEKEKFYDEFLSTYTKKGRDGQVQAMVQVFEDENLKPFIHEFQNTSSDGDFTNLKNNSGQSLFTAHRWHPVLAGVPIAGGMNDAKQIQNVFSIYNKIAIRPNQVFDLNNFINPVFEMMSEWLGLPSVDHQLTLETASPISFYSDIDVNSALTVDEARQHLGQDKLGDERGKQILSTVKPAPTAVPSTPPAKP